MPMKNEFTVAGGKEQKKTHRPSIDSEYYSMRTGGEEKR